MYKVSVIIPVFKVEHFIERCARSLFEQTLDEVQFIFVNDCTPDKSMGILEHIMKEYPQRLSQITILTHEYNKGLPAARNTGLAIARGEYIFHCDSDDYLETDALAEFYHLAREKELDIVWSDWFLTYTHKERYMQEPAFEDKNEALRSILGGGMKFNVWNKLVRRSLYTEHSITFPDGHNMGEDMTMIMLFAVAQRVAYLPKALYHYIRANNNAYTNQQSPQQIADILYNAQRVISFLRDNASSIISQEALSTFQLNVKYPFLISNKKENFQLWRECFPEADKYIHHNKSMGLRARLLQTLAHWKCDWALWLHYKIWTFYYSRYTKA